MKTRMLLGLAVCAIAGVGVWYYMNPSASTATDKPAEAKAAAAPAPKPALAAPVAASKPAQVAAPVAPVVKPGPATAAKAAPATETFIAQPQTDLKSCVATTEHFLETQDVLSLIKTIMPPQAIQQMLDSGQASSIEGIAQHYQQMPDIASKMSQLQWALQNIQTQGQEPEMSPDGMRATYKIDTAISGPGKPDAPAGTPGSISFEKIDGCWYLR